jgi:hypothetical protein
VIIASTESFPANTVYPRIQSRAWSNAINISGTASALAGGTINTNGTITLTGDDTAGETAWYSTTPTAGIGNGYYIRFDIQPDANAFGNSVTATPAVAPNVWYQMNQAFTFTASAETLVGQNMQAAAGASVLYVISTTASEAGRVATGTLNVYAIAEGDDSGGPIN